MKPAITFHVIPRLPERLSRLRDLAYNLRWAWNHDAIDLFRRLDHDLWESSSHNPVLMLGLVSQDQLAHCAADDGFCAQLDRVARDLDGYMAGEASWFRRTYGTPEQPLAAYFSAEFGITGCLSTFAGGLGVLAGDHMKSASDLGVPLVGIGLLYQQGYFRQYLNDAGWQQEGYEDNDFHNLPLVPVRKDSQPLIVDVPCLNGVRAQVWRAQVGRLSLYMLDTNIPANSMDDQNITDQLYGGDRELRLRQEIVLGLGGYHALTANNALAMQPRVFHMNEGHSALLALELIRDLMGRHNLNFAQAREAAAPSLIFTTHTPVSAGHDFFTTDLMKKYFPDYAASLGISWKDFLALGRQEPDNDQELFCMTTVALRLSAANNGVSRLHGQVSREMWMKLWPGVPQEEIPIGHVTNGVHFRSWISKEMDQLYDRYLGARWHEEPADKVLWSRAARIPAEELWHYHERRRERMVAYVRRRLHDQLERRGATQAAIQGAEETLDSEAMTIGFARRFASYKRATLLLHDPERLKKILNHPEHPVQVIFSGAAHPKDNEGKELIRRIVELSRQEPFRRKLVFLEGYGITTTRYLVQGCDVWLNTPRRPMEASGTSGMKAAANGVLNISTLDGWWDEAWQDFGPWTSDTGRTEPIGWAIGRAEDYDDPVYQDQVEAGALYDLLERDVVPTFYERGANGIPRRWVARMRASLGALCYYFNTHRMVKDYTERFYLPMAARSTQLAENGMARAKALSDWKEKVGQNWKQVRAEVVEHGAGADLAVGGEIKAHAYVHLGVLSPSEVAVELYLGLVDADNDIIRAEPVPMHPQGLQDNGCWLYEATATTTKSGLHGYTVRVVPKHADLTSPFLPGLIVWAK